MSNMGYVRFQNTLEDLDDCNEHLWDNNLSDEEVPGIFNTRPFITHRVRMQGLVVFDFAREFPAALTELSDMISAGKLAVREERFEGIEKMPAAFCGLFRGENFGRRVVRVGEEP